MRVLIKISNGWISFQIILFLEGAAFNLDHENDKHFDSLNKNIYNLRRQANIRFNYQKKKANIRFIIMV